MDKDLITKEGYEALKEEHKYKRTVERPKIIEQIDEARSHGDLKENAEYHAAREKQGFIEGRIQRLNYILANSEVIDTSKLSGDTIRFGAKVTYTDMDTDEETSWVIVGEEEANVKIGKISVKSPIAKALLGRKEGDDLIIKVPKGQVEVEITSVSY